MRKKTAHAKARVATPVTWIEADGFELSGGHHRRENERPDCVYGVELGNKTTLGNRIGEPHPDSFNGGVLGVLVEYEAGRFVGEDKFLPAVQGISAKTVCPRPGSQ